MQEKMSNADRRQKTVTALLGAARALFLEKGYAETVTTEVVDRAGVTRGALYHHFRDKEALFQAVVEMEAARIAQEIATRSGPADDPLQMLLRGTSAYLATMREPGRTRLMLLEGPVVLGPETMRRIDMETGGLELKQGLAEAMDARHPPEDIAIMADLVSAMLERAVLASASGDAAAYEAMVIRLLRQLVS